MDKRAAPALKLRDGDEQELQRLLRSSTAPAGLVQRARIVLLAAKGRTNTAIAAQVGVSRPTVISWRSRYETSGIESLQDEERPGRPRRIDRLGVITVTLTPPPKKLGITHWSTRLLASHLGISPITQWPRSGVTTVSSRGAGSRSGSPPTRNWKRRSLTW
jgi:DNA-binding CsgD family transcriptional regulator